MSAPAPAPRIRIENLTMSFGSLLLMRQLQLDIHQGEIFFITGGSGCGKTTLLRHMIGLLEPAEGHILYDGQNFTQANAQERRALLRKFGVTFQNGALWGSMTCLENIALPLQEHTPLPPSDIRAIASYKLALVGLKGFEDYYPHQISGGMRKRVGLARAIALDPDILFFDEVSAGLDPVSSRRLDDLILQMRDALQATIIMVSHELPSIFALGDRMAYLDVTTRTMTALGNPRHLRDHADNPRVREFLNRGSQAA